MKHLTDDQLNEYLDAGTGTQVDTYTRTQVHLTPDTSRLTPLTRHLDTCADCQSRLEEMRTLFTALESLPEVDLPRDLTASVMAKLTPSWGGMAFRPTRSWTWLSLAQAIGAFAILAWLASSFVLPPEIATYQPPTFDSLIASAIQMLSTFTFESPTFEFQSTTIDLQSTTILMFVISAAILWLVGNGLLLRTPQRNNK